MVQVDQNIKKAINIMEEFVFKNKMIDHQILRLKGFMGTNSHTIRRSSQIQFQTNLALYIKMEDANEQSKKDFQKIWHSIIKFFFNISKNTAYKK